MNPVSKLLPAFTRAFHGLTWRRIGVVALLVVVDSVFSWPVATGPTRGLGMGQILESFLHMSAGNALKVLVPILAAFAAYNRAPGGAALRVVAAAAALSVVHALALLGAWRVEAPAYDGLWNRSEVMLIWFSGLALVALVTGMLLAMARADEVAGEVEAERERALALEQGLAEARLSAAQAQIEPHFLFNTLANVRRLLGLDAVAARAMLRQFASLLEAVLPQMRAERTTVGRELALAVAYLSVQQIRMGERLRFETVVPSGLADAELPTMMLPTLVENAIKHGLAPLPQGGLVRIAAEQRGQCLRVTVADSGRGLQASGGTGVGLVNIEARLAAHYGRAGRLDLEQNELGGVTAVIELPLCIVPGIEAPSGERVLA